VFIIFELKPQYHENFEKQVKETFQSIRDSVNKRETDLIEASHSLKKRGLN